MTQEELADRIAEVEQTYRETEAKIDDPYISPARRDAAIRYLAGCGTELARLRAQQR
jgi:hypothetical protein